MKRVALLILIAVISASVTQAQVTFEWVTVGNPGNTADPRHSGVPDIGSVAYAYRIAKYEVTNTQYAEFLNAVAATDSNGLYHGAMGSDIRSGITQSGASGSFTYSVKTNMGNKPVNYVSFFDAFRELAAQPSTNWHAGCEYDRRWRVRHLRRRF